jgi:hypothetical protein
MFASSECLHCDFDMLFLAPDGEEGLSDGDSGSPFDGFSVRSSHSGLETIGPRTRKHLVYTDNVPRVHSASHMESVFSRVFRQIFVRCDTRCFQSVRSYLLSKFYKYLSILLLFVRNDVHRAREFVTQSFFPSYIIYSDFRVRHSSAVSRLRIRFVLLISVAFSWSSTHLRFRFKLY